MTTHSIFRTGMRPLVFDGECLAVSPEPIDEALIHPSTLRRLHRVALFRTTSGRYVVEILYRSTWGNEPDHTTAHVCDSPEAVALALERHDPCAVVIGFPPIPKFKEKQRQLLLEIRAAYAQQVQEILSKLPGGSGEERV